MNEEEAKLRNQYAGLAMQGLLSNDRIFKAMVGMAEKDSVSVELIIAQLALKNANALLDAIHKEDSK